MKKQFGLTVVELLGAVIILAGIGGWIANVVKIASDFIWPPTGMLILRIIGIFMIPLGSVLGFL